MAQKLLGALPPVGTYWVAIATHTTSGTAGRGAIGEKTDEYSQKRVVVSGRFNSDGLFQTKAS